MSKQTKSSSVRCVRGCMLAVILAGSMVPIAARAGTAFTWDPGAVLPSLGGPFAADSMDATHYLYDVSPTAITPTDIYTVHFLEPITGFTRNGASVATPGLNGTPGAPGSYGLYVTMQNQTEAIGPPKTYNYLSGQIKLMLDPGNNDGTASATLSGVGFSNTGPTGTADDITLATGSLISGRFAFGSTPGVRSIGTFVETFQPAGGEGGFFVTLPTDLIKVIDTTFTGDLVQELDPSDPALTIGMLNNGSTVIGFVPEPASLLLLGVGLAGLVVVHPRQNRQRPR